LVSTTDSTQKDVAKVTTTFTPLPSYGVDLLIGNGSGESDYAGNGITETTPSVQVRTQSVNSNEVASYYFKAENEGNVVNYLKVTGESGSGNVAVTYLQLQLAGQLKVESL